MRRFIDLTGRRFGRWVVIKKHPERQRYPGCVFILWLCRCDCGTERPVIGNSLRQGTSTNCGCLKRENFIKRVTMHGMSKTAIYAVWKAMRQRCSNPNHPEYVNYGARGVCVCQRWESFELFYSDVGDPPAGLTLDRRNNDGNYEPGNWRWATRSEQNTNRRRPRKKRRSSVQEIARFAASLRLAGGLAP
jgi:hypothetical protein